MRTMVCAIGAGENNYIREWVEWYKSLGFTNVCLYDNNNIDGEHFQDVIGDYITDGFVILKDCRGKKGFHQTSYELCYNEFGDNYDWIAFFDIDEFMELDKKYKNVEEFFSEDFFKDAQTIRISWKHFDDNDLVRVIDGNYNVVNRFTRIANEKYSENGWDKGILRGGLGQIKVQDSVDGAHMNGISQAQNAVNCAGKKVDWKSMHNGRCWENAWLNHYRYKTIEEYVWKRNRGWTVKGYSDEFVKNLFSLSKFYTINKKTDEKTELFNELIKKSEEQ